LIDLILFGQRFKFFIKNNLIWLLLILGLINGLIFVFWVPPWMHYDEPGHFEYAWLIANRPGFPGPGDYDQDMRRQLSASIIEHDIYGYTGMTTDPFEVDQPIIIWTTHTSTHSPTYYFLAGLPLRLLKNTDITLQLYAMRLVSLGLFLAVIWMAYRTCRTLFGAEHPLTWMVPLFIVTLPSFVDLMTAANNDVGAIFAFTLFTWLSAEMIKKGFSILRLMALIASVVLCYLVKNTAWTAIPLSFLVLLFTLLKGKRYEKFIWIALGVGLVLVVALVISWQESAPAYFYGWNMDANPMRQKVINTPVGERAIVQESQRADVFQFYHILLPEDRAALAGKTVTFGAWIWADEPTSIEFPGVREGQLLYPNLIQSPVPTVQRTTLITIKNRQVAETQRITFSQEAIQLTQEPQFFAYNIKMPPMGGDIGWIYFPNTVEDGNRIYWDGIVMLEGVFDPSTPPVFDDSQAQTGSWDGLPFTNIIRNASGERLWSVLAAPLRELMPDHVNLSPSNVLSVLDIRASGRYFQYAAERIFRTFWAVFGWASVPLYGQKPYRFLFALTIIYLIAILVAIFRKAYRDNWRAMVIFAVAAGLQIFITWFRGAGSWFIQTYIPVARYIYPVILPLSLLMVSGFEQLMLFIHKTTKTSKAVLYGAYVFLQLGIIIWAILSIHIFYRL